MSWEEILAAVLVVYLIGAAWWGVRSWRVILAPDMLRDRREARL